MTTAVLTNRSRDMTLRAAPISQLWMLRPGEANETQKKSPSLEGMTHCKGHCKIVLLISWIIISHLWQLSWWLILSGPQTCGHEALNKEKIGKQDRQAVQSVEHTSEANAMSLSIASSTSYEQQPPATGCWFLHNRINVQQICKCDNLSLLFPCLMADFFRLRRGYGFF